MKQYRNVIIIGVLLTGLLAFTGYYRQSETIPPPADTSEPVRITLPNVLSPNTAYQADSFNLLLDLGPGKKSLQENFVVGANLFDAFKTATAREGIEMKSKEYPGAGYIVESVGGLKNGADGKYWQFWVNGQYSNVGASSYVIRPGDVVEWKFTNEQ